MKLCPRCKANPSPKATNPNGHTYCPPCNKAYKSEYHQKHKSEIQAKVKAWRKANPAARKAARRRYFRRPNGKLALMRSFYKTRYGLTLERFEAMIVEQDGCCAICGRKPKRLHVDHDHASGQVRGLLCGPCNRGIGLMQESPDVLSNAIRYLMAQQRKAA